MSQWRVLLSLPPHLREPARRYGNLSGAVASMLVDSDLAIRTCVYRLEVEHGMLRDDTRAVLVALRGASGDAGSEMAGIMLCGALCPELSAAEAERVERLAWLAESDAVASSMLRLAHECWRGARYIDEAMARLPGGGERSDKRQPRG